MANKRDYYEVLGIDKNATDEDIKRAYRKKAKECHPDLHPNDKEAEARFKELNEANEVLSDPDKRARYDQFGFDGPDMGGGISGDGAGIYGGLSGNFVWGRTLCLSGKWGWKLFRWKMLCPVLRAGVAWNGMHGTGGGSGG